MKRFKMGVFNNLQLHDNFDIKEYMQSFNDKIQTGFKLDKNNNYDMQQKRLANLAEAVDAADAITKHQMEVGLSNKSDQTNVLLLDGRNHMTGDLDMRGNKIILPSGIDMNRKLITNLDTDQNQDLSAVNMVTLKTNIGQKVDKKYVDDENAKLVKKTGDTLSGDLILPHDSYPVQGNTNKAVSYETQREIFLSRKESFPMQADINMNNNFLQNVATPTSSHQGANKGYCDYNFLNRQKGGRIMGSLSMNQNDLFEIPAPKYGSSAVNKNYVDSKIPSGFVKKAGDQMACDLNMNGHKITNLPTPSTSNEPPTKNYVDSKVSVGGAGKDLDMKNFKIKNLASPTAAQDAVNKKYFDEELLKSHLVSSHIENSFKYLVEQDESSSERNIIVNGIVDFNGSPYKNKKAYDIDLVYTAGTQNYNSKIGINLYSLPIGKYSVVMEYFFPEDINISLSAEASTAVIAKQVTTNFPNYKKLLVQIDQQTKDTPDYLYFNIRGSGTTTTNPEGYLVFYGVKEWMDSVPPQIYDHALETGMFSYENGKMNMDLDFNGNSLDGVSFFIPGWYEQAKDTHGIFLNPIHEFQIIPFDCVLNKIVFLIVDNNLPSIRLATDVTVGSFYKIYHILTNRRKKIEIDTNVIINKNDLLKIRFPVIKENSELSSVTKAVFSFSFSLR